MGKKVLLVTGVLIFGIVGYLGYFFFYQSRQLSPRKQIMYEEGNVLISLDYGRPSKRGRIIFGDGPTALQPFGQYWRMGANQRTILTTNAEINVMGNKLEPGSHYIFAIPDREKWQVFFCDGNGRWGARPPAPEHEIFRIHLQTMETDAAVEKLTFSFEPRQDTAIALVMEWDVVRLEIPIKH